jgi:hypothetical protein
MNQINHNKNYLIDDIEKLNRLEEILPNFSSGSLLNA